METIIFKVCISLSLLVFFSSFLSLGHALSPTGTIKRATKQQILASLLPATTTGSPNELLFLTSPLGKYSAFLIRRETAIGAGGFRNDFCYIQIVEEEEETGSGGTTAVWESECAPISNVNTCTLLFSDAGLEIYNGSNSAWDTNADGDNLQRLDLLDAGDMQIRGEDSKLAWKASDEPNVNQNCGSIGGPGMGNALPPLAKPISNGNSPFGIAQQSQQLGYQQQQQTRQLGYQQQQLPFSNAFNQPLPNNLNQQQQLPFSNAFNQPLPNNLKLQQQQPFSNAFNQPLPNNLNQQQQQLFVGNYNNNNHQQQQGLVDNAPFDSGVSRENVVNVGGVLLWTLMAVFFML